LIKDTLSKDPVTIGWLFALPWTVTLAAMYWLGRHSDATGERRWHLALSLIVAAAAFAVSAIPGIPGVLGFMALTVATAGIVSSFTVFWALPTAILSGTAAAAGIAWINSIGNLGGWLGPYAVGLIRDWTHSMTMALLTLSGAAMAAALIALYATVRRPASFEGRSLAVAASCSARAHACSVDTRVDAWSFYISGGAASPKGDRK
jgi:nitrate/nitrite transporter NarK